MKRISIITCILFLITNSMEIVFSAKEKNIPYLMINISFLIFWSVALLKEVKRYNENTFRTDIGKLNFGEMQLRTFQKLVHINAKNHGWWNEERQFGELIALCHSELSEALEEYRKGKKPNETYYTGDEHKMEGIPSELADVVIRIMDMCEHYDIDLQGTILEKHKFNISRPYKHGGKVI